MRPTAFEVWDTTTSGLVPRVTGNGVCIWSVRRGRRLVGRTASGQRVRPAIGGWPAVGIASARKQAEVLLGQIAAGINPSETKAAGQARRVAK